MANNEKKRGRVENLSVIRDTETAKARGKLGGIANGVSHQKRRLVSQIVGEWLLKEHDVSVYDPISKTVKQKKVSTDELFDRAMTMTLARGDGATASMLKAIADINEGKTINLNDLGLSLTPEERDARIAELEARRAARKTKK